MAARAIWKGVIHFGGIAVPVKLFSAVADRNVHFRLLHKKDHSPVRQAMVNPETQEIVPYNETRRAYISSGGREVILTQEELEELKPEKSREIAILAFLPPEAIDHRWYDRPYYLGPDGAEDKYAALTQALQAQDREGLARWVMRNKEYLGALRPFEGYLMLISLRHEEQVVSAEELEPPGGKPLDKRELEMARQLIGMLEARFEPGDYRDDYRHQVLELIDKKQKGGRIRRAPRRKTEETPEDLGKALEASLKSVSHG
ncbi:Ku protein [Kineobactrum sediminis]|uniref:Non-homologous end joining protein Ku n=1 Tax=Kineobactrum sediminis TaxID=1905677 RepID=A0A2N5Y745_9GAMM|nr:Ku protein [Kineobactrum sediminis]PLW84211.1 Ku protein [Kineobactrum sediminis]